jgi:hypothetical protein
MTTINTVVCVHGFWSHGAGMYLIKRRLEKEYGMRALLFSYPSVRGTLDDNAALCVGSPLTGSRAANFMSRQDWAEPIIGNSLRAGVVHEAANEWGSHVCHEREVGIIAGTVPIGFGKLVADFDEKNDGTIAVSETRLEGAKDHICLQVSHKGMLVSNDVADQAAAFLRRGEFLRDL